VREGGREGDGARGETGRKKRRVRKGGKEKRGEWEGGVGRGGISIAIAGLPGQARDVRHNYRGGN